MGNGQILTVRSGCQGSSTQGPLSIHQADLEVQARKPAIEKNLYQVHYPPIRRATASKGKLLQEASQFHPGSPLRGHFKQVLGIVSACSVHKELNNGSGRDGHAVLYLAHR